MTRGAQRRGPGRAIVLGLAGVLVLCGTAWATPAPPKAGAYRTSGHARFPFRLTVTSCVSPPKNLKNPKARPGKAARGFCFTSTGSVPVNPSCGSLGHPIHGEVVDVSLFDNLRLGHGALHVKAYIYGESSKPIGYSELDLAVHGTKGSGYLRETGQDAGHACDTGKLTFTAALKR